jgi:hypothetical protein
MACFCCTMEATPRQPLGHQVPHAGRIPIAVERALVVIDNCTSAVCSQRTTAVYSCQAWTMHHRDCSSQCNCEWVRGLMHFPAN